MSILLIFIINKGTISKFSFHSMVSCSSSWTVLIMVLCTCTWTTARTATRKLLMNNELKMFHIPSPKSHLWIILSSFLRIAENFISFNNFSELFQWWFIFVDIRVKLLGKFVKVFLYLLVLCIKFDSKNFIAVLMLSGWHWSDNIWWKSEPGPTLTKDMLVSWQTW